MKVRVKVKVGGEGGGGAPNRGCRPEVNARKAPFPISFCSSELRSPAPVLDPSRCSCDTALYFRTCNLLTSLLPSLFSPFPFTFLFTFTFPFTFTLTFRPQQGIEFLESGGRADFVEALLYFVSGEVSIRHQSAVNSGEVHDFIARPAVKGARAQQAYLSELQNGLELQRRYALVRLLRSLDAAAHSGIR